MAGGQPPSVPPPDDVVAVAEAEYRQARAESVEGRNGEALALVERARGRLMAAGHRLAAMRMDLGRMHVLNELGRHQEAVALGEGLQRALTAEELSEELRWLVPAAAKNTGVSLGFLGAHTEALSAYRAAETGFEALGMAEEVAALRNNQGVELLDLGRPVEASAMLRDAVDRFRGMDDPEAAAESSRHLAEAHVATGRLEAARRTLGAAAVTFREGGMTTQWLRTRLTAAEVDLALGLVRTAEEELGKLVNELLDASLLHDACRALVSLGVVQARGGRPEEAIATLGSAADVARQVGSAPLQAEVHLAHAGVARRTGELRRAEAQLEAAATTLQDGEWPLQRLALSLESAAVRLADDPPDTAGAARHLDHAVELGAEVQSAALQLSHLRLQAALAEAQGRPTAAVEHLELAATMALAVGERVGDPLSRLSFMEDKARVLDDLARLHATVGDGAARSLEVLERRKSTVLHDELAAVSAAGRSSAPAVEAGAARPSPQMAFQLHDGRLRAFWREQGEVALVRDVDATGLPRLVRQLSGQWRRQRAGRGIVGRHQQQLRAATDATLVTVDQLVLGDLRERLVAAGEVEVSLDGVLHDVPFAALGGSEDPLVRHVTLCSTPALGRPRPLDDSTGVLDRGAVVVGVADADAPAVDREVAAVAERIRGAVLLRGGAATVDQVRASLAGAGVLHLAGHAVHDGEAPMRSAIRLADRWLTAADLASWPLHGRVLVLSACGTARSAPLGGERLGLARAALVGGARAVVVAKWDIPDDGTVALVVDLYDRLLAGDGPARALRAAQLRAVDHDLHPYRWAAFDAVRTAPPPRETP